MATAREIRRRIRSIHNIRQITRALEAVSASNVRRAQEAVTATRPYAQKARELLARVASLAGGETRHPLLTKRPAVKSVLILLISSDRGLAGPFNTNVARGALEFARASGKSAGYVTMGRKGRDFIYRRGGNLVADFSPLPPRPNLLDTTGATRTLIDDFLSGKTDEVYLAYTEFHRRAAQKPVLVKLLPLEAVKLQPEQATAGPRAVYDFEPGPQEILDILLPRLTEVLVYQAVLNSLASEHAARMAAMHNATEGATDLISSYTLAYNKARQQSITSELLDISGGAEALAQLMGTNEQRSGDG